MNREIEVRREDGAKLKLTPIETAKLIQGFNLEMISKLMFQRLMDPERRQKITDKDLADWWDKSAKYLFPRDVRISVSDPETLQVIMNVIVRFLGQDQAHEILEAIMEAMQGNAISKYMSNSGVDIEDLAEAQ